MPFKGAPDGCLAPLAFDRDAQALAPLADVVHRRANVYPQDAADLRVGTSLAVHRQHTPLRGGGFALFFLRVLGQQLQVREIAQAQLGADVGKVNTHRWHVDHEPSADGSLLQTFAKEHDNALFGVC